MFSLSLVRASICILWSQVLTRFSLGLCVLEILRSPLDSALYWSISTVVHFDSVIFIWQLNLEAMMDGSLPASLTGCSWVVLRNLSACIQGYCIVSCSFVSLPKWMRGELPGTLVSVRHGFPTSRRRISAMASR